MATSSAQSGSLKSLSLKNFKSFAKADIRLGPLTVIVGTNASGKSNLRDAFRFLHGISRGYTLSDIIGEKWVEGGVLQWRGIRGGIREVAAPGATSFTLAVEYQSAHWPQTLIYKIEVAVGKDNGAASALTESLYHGSTMFFESDPDAQIKHDLLSVAFPRGGKYRKGHREDFIASRPALLQVPPRLAEKRTDRRAREVIFAIKELVEYLSSMRFLDLSPDAMRLPSTPGQLILGDRGENLSSVLEAVAKDPKKKETLIQWIQELTPMDVRDLDFPADQTGKVLLRLIEDNDQQLSAHSASDGTLRFLTMIAALLGPEPARFYFFEELENGIHPTRLHLLLQLIEQKVFDGGIQMVATTHSPQLLGLLSPQSLEYAALTYRLPGRATTEIKRIVDIPEAQEVLKSQDLARLHASGWLENVAAFAEDVEKRS